MDKREMRFRAAADQVIRSNRKIRDKIRAVKPFYLGDETAPEPPLKSRLETVLNPKGNGACKCLDLLCSAAKEYRPGEYPAGILDLLNKTTLSLIHDEIEPIQRTPICNMLVTLVNDIHGYFMTPIPPENFSIEKHCQKIDKIRDKWSTCCCKNSDAFYVKTSELINARKKAKEKAKDEGEGIRRSGKAKRQADWRKDDPVILKRRDDTKRVIAEIHKRHKAGASYAKAIADMRASDVWRMRMKHRTAESWRSEAIKHSYS